MLILVLSWILHGNEDRWSGEGMIGLTHKQTELLDVIKEFIEEHGVAPSFDEMAAALGKGKSQIHRLVVKLVERGAIYQMKGRARAIEVADARDLVNLGFLPVNHRQFLAWHAIRTNTTPEKIVADLVRVWAIRTAG